MANLTSKKHSIGLSEIGDDVSKLDASKSVMFFVPDLIDGKGGIQVFSRYFLTALKELVTPSDLQVLVKNDFSGEPSSSLQYGYYTAVGNWPSFLRTLGFVLAGVYLTWRERPRLLISTHLHFGPLARFIKQFYKVPYILVAHGIDAWCVEGQQRIAALSEADLVLAVSRYTRDFLLREFQLAPERIKLLPNTFAPDRFTIRPKSGRLLARYGFTEHNKIILMVCRLAEVERYKGYDKLIEALPTIAGSLPETRFLLVGTGPDRNRIEKMCVQTGVQNNVVFAGFVPDSELSEHYNLCDLFAMPSKAEGFGIVYLEALACGKPVLAGNKDGSRDALADGELGVLIDPDNVDEIADSCIQILQGTHTHPLIYQPVRLRHRAIELFGFESFKMTLRQHLAPYL